MNWLSQMIHTEIDLTRMYPADQPRSRTPKVKTKVVDHAAVKRSNKVRAGQDMNGTLNKQNGE